MKSMKQMIRGGLLSLLALPLLLSAATAAQSAERVLRIVTLTATSAEEQAKGLAEVNGDVQKVYKEAKGCESVTFFADKPSLRTGSVSVWSSRADLDAFLKSPAYKSILARLVPHMKGTPVTNIYAVNEPAK